MVSIKFKYLYIIILVLDGVLVFAGRSFAQQSQKYFSAEFEIGMTASGAENLPFWLHTNRWGTVDRTGANGYTRINTRINVDTLGVLKLKAGADLFARLANANAVFFNQLYFQADWHFLRMVAGRKIETMGMSDTTLTSGSMIQSGNAGSIPKIRIFTPNFVEIPGTNDWLSVKGYLSHGWMESGRFIDDPWLHQKYLYLRMGPDHFPVHLIAGVVQSTIWAGTHPEDGDFPDSFKEFWNVFTARQSNATNAESSPLGSTVGIYDLGLKYNFRDFDGMIYRQFYLETAKGAKLRNPWDGLWGISINWDKSFKLINRLFWEHLNTKRQSSKTGRDGSVSGFDNYYNNSTYLSGWTYHGRTIGNPLLFSDGTQAEIRKGTSVSRAIIFIELPACLPLL